MIFLFFFQNHKDLMYCFTVIFILQHFPAWLYISRLITLIC